MTDYNENVEYMIYQEDSGGGCITLEQGSVPLRRLVAIAFGLPADSDLSVAYSKPGDTGWEDLDLTIV